MLRVAARAGPEIPATTSEQISVTPISHRRRAIATVPGHLARYRQPHPPRTGPAMTKRHKPDPFWRTVPLAEMTPAQWESLCDGCGKCCLNKLEEVETDRTYYTSVGCRLLSPSFFLTSSVCPLNSMVPLPPPAKVSSGLSSLFESITGRNKAAAAATAATFI